MSGHATKKEIQDIQALETRLDLLRSPVEDMIRLGQFYLCPMHDEERAMVLFKQVLERDPLNPWAVYWLSYIYLWEMMDRASILSARAMLESWLASTTEHSPTAEAKAAILQRLVQVRDSPDLQDLSDSERIKLLEKSVGLAPHWVINRWYLARAYVAVGRTTDAIVQLDVALANAVPNDPNWDAADKLFESDVTGCFSPHLANETQKMLRELRGLEGEQ